MNANSQFAREEVESPVQGRDVVVVQPAGAGKSAGYRIAGLMIEGVIISPLIALTVNQCCTQKVGTIAYRQLIAGSPEP